MVNHNTHHKSPSTQITNFVVVGGWWSWKWHASDMLERSGAEVPNPRRGETQSNLKGQPANFKQGLENGWPVSFQFCLKFVRAHAADRGPELEANSECKAGQYQPTLGNRLTQSVI